MADLKTCSNSSSFLEWLPFFLALYILGLYQIIIFIVGKSVNYFLDQLISCLLDKMSENGAKFLSVFPKAKDDILNCLLFCPQPSDIQFAVTED